MKTKTRYKAHRDGGAVMAEAPRGPELSIAIDTDASANDVANDASEAFKQQINNLRSAEDIQRNRAFHEEKVKQILAENPDMVRHPGLTALAEREAIRAGVEPYTDEFHAAVKNSFDKHMGRTPKPDAAPEEKMFERFPEAPSRVAYSAPVSRETQATGHYTSQGERTGQVTLSAEMRDMARRLGQTEKEYAQGLLEMRQRDKDYGR